MDAAAVQNALHAMQAQLQQQAQQLQQHQQAAAAAAAAAAVAPSPAARRVKIPAASNYAGSPSMLDGWLREMRQQFDWYQISADTEQVSMAAAQLRSTALDWWCAQLSTAEQASLKTSFVQFEMALRSRFQPVNSAQTARLALDSLRQGSKQSVHDYTSAFRRLLVSVPDMSEADKVHRFVQGLRGAAQTQLIVHGADTLDKAIAMAARVGSLAQYAASSAAVAGSTPMELAAMLRPGDSGDADASDDDANAPVTRGEWKQLLAAMQQRHSSPSQGAKRAPFGRGSRGAPRVSGLTAAQVRERLDSGLCFVCGEAGHRKYDCPQNKSKEKSGN
jgi:hypothetical protein